MKRWVIAIVCLLSANVLASVGLAVIANNGGTQVIPRYYDHAIHYDDVIAAAARDRDLGWKIDMTTRDGIVEVELHDASGAAICDAHVVVTGYARVEAGHAISMELVGTGAGRYASSPRLERRGWHDFAVIAARGKHQFHRRVAIEAR